MKHYSSATIRKICSALGFDVEIVGSTSLHVHGDRRTIYTVKRTNGSKHYHAVMYGNGMVRAC